MASTALTAPKALTQEAGTPKPPGAEIGAQSQFAQGGLPAWSAFIDEQEFVPELTWPNSILVYHRMRSDSQLEALHEGTTKPIKDFRWSIDPNSAPAGIAENVAADFGLPLRGEEDEDVPRASNRFKFDQFLSDALLALLFGHSTFEVVGEMQEAAWRMVGNGLISRHPRTIQQFVPDDNGDLGGIRQSFSRSGLAMPPLIPSWKLLHFVWRMEAGSIIGRSMLRPVYREWLVKDRVIRVGAINIERGGGVPVVYGAQGMGDDQVRDLANLARQFKVAEGGGGALPFGTKLNLEGGNVPDAIAFLKYCDECMARMWGLMLVQLGTTSFGSRALGSEFAAFAASAQRAVARWITDTVNDWLDRCYTQWNDPFASHAPRLHYENSKPEALSTEELVKLVEVGALTVDPEFEEWLRAERGLPEKPEPPDGGEDLGELSPDEVALVQSARNPPALPTPEAQPGDGASPPPAPSSAPSTALARAASATAHPTHIERTLGGVRASLTLPERTLGRLPSENEIRAAVDFKGLDGDHSKVLSSLQGEWLSKVLPAQIDTMASQIKSVPELTRDAILRSVQAPVLGQDVLDSHLLRAAQSGAGHAVRELQAQGVSAHLHAPTDAHLGERVADQASALARLNANAVTLAAQRKAAQLVSEGGRTRGEIAQRVTEHLAAQKHVWEREQLRGAVTMAQNQGRIGVFEAQPNAEELVYEASEMLDERTCFHPCTMIATETGAKRADEITMNDRLLTHAGRYIAPTWIAVSGVDDELVWIDAGAHSLAVTPEHEVLVSDDRGFRWVHAGDLAVGDLMVSETTLKKRREAVAENDRLAQSPDDEPARFEVGGLAGIDLGSAAVPVVAVGLDSQAGDEEVHHPRSYLRLAQVANAPRLQQMAQAFLDVCLSAGRHVAATRAVARTCFGARHDAKRLAAVAAGDDGGRPTTRLRAIVPTTGVAVTEGRATALADRIGPAVGARATARAVVVAGGVGGGNLERGPASDADLRDAISAAADVRLRVGAAALVRAVNGAHPVGARDLATTGLAVARGAAAFGGTRTLTTAAAPWPDLHGRPAIGTPPIHEGIVFVRVEAVEHTPYTGPVYDFSLPPDGTLFADGLLVHNCDNCEGIDGTIFDNLDEAVEAYAGGGYVDCEGGPNCRGTLIAVAGEQNAESGAGKLAEAEPAYTQPAADESE